MNTIDKIENAKIIGIGDDGIKTLDSIVNKVAHNMDLEKISISQDVDKDYVRTLLDGVDTLFLTYNSEDKNQINVYPIVESILSQETIGAYSNNIKIKAGKLFSTKTFG